MEDESLKWEECEARLRNWLARAAKHRAGANAKGWQIAEILGVSPSAWTRWPKDPG